MKDSPRARKLYTYTRDQSGKTEIVFSSSVQVLE